VNNDFSVFAVFVDQSGGFEGLSRLFSCLSIEYFLQASVFSVRKTEVKGEG